MKFWGPQNIGALCDPHVLYNSRLSCMDQCDSRCDSTYVHHTYIYSRMDQSPMEVRGNSSNKLMEAVLASCVTPTPSYLSIYQNQTKGWPWKLRHISEFSEFLPPSLKAEDRSNCHCLGWLMASPASTRAW
jgi:hypothetical protein